MQYIHSIVLTRLAGADDSTYQLVDGFLFWAVQLHGAGHVGRDRTITLIQRYFFWPTLRQNVSHFVEYFRVCHISKGAALNAGLYTLSKPVP